MLQMGGCSYNAFPDNGRLLHQSKIHIINIIVNVIISNIIHLPYMVIGIVDHWFSSKQHMKIDVQCLAMTNNHYNDNCPIARKVWKCLALQQHCVLQCIAMTNNSITLMTKTMQGWNMNIFHHCWLRTPELSAPGQTRQLVRSHLHLHLQLFLECEQLYCQLLLVKENHVPNFHHLFSCPSLCLAFEL